MNQLQKRIVTISLPNAGFEQVATISLEQDSPYKLIEEIRPIWKHKLENSESYFGHYESGEILPIHNASGIRDHKLVSQMQENLKIGQDILEMDQLPNIKIVVAPNQKLLLFDGHHSLLSYFNLNKKFLREIPYIVISAEEYKGVKPEEISQFFPENERTKIISDWEKYTVNWQAKVGEQMTIRNVGSIRQLVLQLGKRNEGTVEK